MRRHDKPFVCVDVDIPRNPRVASLEDPAGSLGLWLSMLAYSREQLTDGVVPKRYAVSMWGEAKKNEARLAGMIGAELIADHGDRYEVLRYAPRNQTRGMVEEARRRARERMTGVRANRTRTVCEPTEKFAEQAGVVLTSTSLSSLSLSREGESEREIRVDDKLTDELREIASMNAVQDVESAWRRFCGKRAGRWVHVAGEWQAWCVSWAKYERSERERNRAKEPPRSPAKRVVDVQARLAQEAEERRRG